MSLLALLVALLKAVPLAHVMETFAILQGVALIGVEGARDLPLFSKEASVVMTYINFSQSNMKGGNTQRAAGQVTPLSSRILPLFAHAPSLCFCPCLCSCFLLSVNFDVELLKPGCAGVPQFDYVAKVRFTLLLMLMSACLFFAGCILRLILNVRAALKADDALQASQLLDDEDESAEPSKNVQGDTSDAPSELVSKDANSTRITVRRNKTLPLARTATTIRAQLTTVTRPTLVWRTIRRMPAFTDFKQRCVHALLILLSIFYLRVASLLFKCFVCVESADPAVSTDSDAAVTHSLYLREDYATRCYTRFHLATSIGAIILLLVYTLGYPLFCFRLLMRAFTDERTTGVLGWLRRRFACLRGRKRRRLQSIIIAAPHKAAPAALLSPDELTAARQLGSPTHAPSPSMNNWMINSPSHATAAPVAASPTADPPTDADKDVAATVTRLPDAPVSSIASTEPTAAELQRDRENLYGFLFISLRAGAWPYSVIMLLLSCYSAAIKVFVDDADMLLKLFLFGIMWSCSTLLTAVYLPFSHWSVNAKNVLLGLGSLAHSTTLLGAQHAGTQSSYFWLLLAAFALIVVMLLVRERLARALPCLKIVRRKELVRQRALVIRASGDRTPSPNSSPEPSVTPRSSRIDSIGHGDEQEEKKKEEVEMAVRADDEADDAAEAVGEVAVATVAIDDAAVTAAIDAAAMAAAVVDATALAARVDAAEVAAAAHIALPDSSRESSAHVKYFLPEEPSSEPAPEDTSENEASLSAAEEERLLFAEETRLEVAAAREEAAQLRAASKASCALPPTMLARVTEFVQRRPAAGWPDVPHCEAELREFIREAFKGYERACMMAQSPSGTLAASLGAAAAASVSSTLQLPGTASSSSSSSSSSHVRTRSGADVFVSRAAATAAARLHGDLLLHVESQLHHWRAVMARFEVMAQAAAFNMQMRHAKALMQASLATLLASDDVAVSTRGSAVAGHCVRMMSEHVAFGDVLARMAAECAERTRLLEEVDRLQQVEAEQAEQAEIEAALAPSELGAAIAELDAVVEDEAGHEGGAEASAATTASHASTAPSSKAVQSGLSKLRASALMLLANKRATAAAAGDDGQRAHFDSLYAQLVNSEVTVDQHKRRQLEQADQAFLAKLKKGKTRAAAAVLDAAVREWALLEVMREDERAQQERVMQEKIKRRAEEKAAKAAARREQARRNVAVIRRAAHTAAAADALSRGGAASKAPRLLVPLTLAGRSLLPEETALKSKWQRRRLSKPVLPLPPARMEHTAEQQ
jgi:hypothetical protein